MDLGFRSFGGGLYGSGGSWSMVEFERMTSKWRL